MQQYFPITVICFFFIWFRSWMLCLQVYSHSEQQTISERISSGSLIFTISTLVTRWWDWSCFFNSKSDIVLKTQLEHTLLKCIILCFFMSSLDVPSYYSHSLNISSTELLLVECLINNIEFSELLKLLLCLVILCFWSCPHLVVKTHRLQNRIC